MDINQIHVQNSKYATAFTKYDFYESKAGT